MAMFVARLSISLLASLVSGAVAARFDRSGGGAPIACGTLQLLIAAPYHVMIWDQYPAWYHLFYLFSLIPVAMFGGRLASSLGRRSAA